MMMVMLAQHHMGGMGRKDWKFFDPRDEEDDDDEEN